MYNSYSLTKCISLTVRFESRNYSLVHGLQGGCCVSHHGNNISLLVCFYQSSWVARNIVNEQGYFEKNLFFFFFLNSKSQQCA